MQTITPPTLQPGDTVGIVSPSAPSTPEFEKNFREGVTYLEGLGLKVRVGSYVHSTTLGYSTAPEEKAADFNDMIHDPAVRMILATQGGTNANMLLPHIDYAALQADPRIVLGISDITVLLNAIHHKTGLVTYHGNDLQWGFGNDPTAYDKTEFERTLMAGKWGPVPANGERKCVRPGKAVGKILGGNLGCLLKLAGTPYWPEMAGAILILETFMETPETADCKLRQLAQMGVFEQINGLVIGYNYGLDTEFPHHQHLATLALAITDGLDFPILKTLDFGHNTPNTTLPIGGLAGMDVEGLAYWVMI